MACNHCGKRRGHTNGCDLVTPKLENGERVTVEICRHYFDNLGLKNLTPNQYAMWKWMLTTIEYEAWKAKVEK